MSNVPGMLASPESHNIESRVIVKTSIAGPRKRVAKWSCCSEYRHRVLPQHAEHKEWPRGKGILCIVD